MHVEWGVWCPIRADTVAASRTSTTVGGAAATAFKSECAYAVTAAACAAVRCAGLTPFSGSRMTNVIATARQANATVGSAGFTGFTQGVFAFTIAAIVADIAVGAVPFVVTFAMIGFERIIRYGISSPIPADAVTRAVICAFAAAIAPALLDAAAPCPNEPANNVDILSISNCLL